MTRALTAAAALTLALSACKPAVTPTPLAVTVVPDATHAERALVTPQGGSVTATAADGTTFDLLLPENAVLSPVELTLTPATVTGLPLRGGSLAAVQLEPEGLRLLAAATLLVSPPGGAFATPAGQRLVGFGWHGTGAELHLAPSLDLDGARQLELYHFSGVGLGAGTGDELAAQARDHPPTSAEDQAAQGLAGGGSSEPVLRAFGQQVLSTCQAAAANEALLDAAYTQYVAWKGLVTGAGLLATFAAEDQLMTRALADGLRHGVEQASETCQRDHDPAQAAVILRLVSWAMLRPEVQVNVPDLPRLRELALKCARFELTFVSQAVVTTPDAPTITVGVTSTVVLTAVTDVAPLVLQGSASLTHTEASFPPAPNCTSSVSTTDGTLSVPTATLELNAGVGASREVTLTVGPDGLHEIVTYVCDGMASPPEDTMVWAAVFTGAHEGELDADGYVIRGWEAGEGDVYAVRRYAQSYVIDPPVGAETTTFTLRHTPAP